jgi:hypothetical protein
MLYSVRADQEVARKGPENTGVRRRTVKLPAGPRTLIIGRNPVYLSCEELPTEIENDAHLVVEAVDRLDPGTEVIYLSETGPPVPELKSERVQKPRRGR